MAVQRDINKEKLALKSYQSIYKKNPTTSEDWANLHRIAYPVTAGGLPDELKSSVDQSLYAGTGMASATGATAPTGIDALSAGVDTAAANVQKTSQPNEALRILQEAIRAKSGQANQPIGENPLFKQLGVTGYGALGASIASQGDKLDMDFSNFKNIVGQMSGTYKDMATAALNNYEIAYTRYKDAADKITQEEKDLRDHAQAMELVNTNFQNSLKLKQYEQSHPGIDDQLKVDAAGKIIDDKGNLVDKPYQSSSFIGNVTVTGANGSDIWKPGLDVVVAGGKGAPVNYPFTDNGKVIAIYNTAKPGDKKANGGFGNQVQIKTSSGDIVMMSHLDSVNVKVGDVVTQITKLGAQGNTGNTYSLTGGDGTHLDITMKNKNGQYYTAPEVSEMMGIKGSGNDNASDMSLNPNSQSILSATGLSMPAFMFLTQGTSALTRMTADQRLKYMKEAESYVNKTGTDVATFQSQYSALGKTVEANSLRNNQASVAEEEIRATILNLSDAAKEAGLSNLSSLNVGKIFSGTQLNDPKYFTYKTHLEQLRNEFAMYNAALSGQLDANGNVRAISDEDKVQADKILQNGINQKGIDGFEKAILSSKDKMNTVLKNSIDAQNKQVWKLFGVGDKFKSSPDNNTSGATVEKDGMTFKQNPNGDWVRIK